MVVEDNARREIDDRIPPVNDDATGEVNAEDKRGKNVSSRRLRGVIPLFSWVSNDDDGSILCDKQCADFLFDMSPPI